jgi:hypothetical protein
MLKTGAKIKSLLQLFELITEEERIIVDVLRQIVLENLPSYCKEKISYSVPFFYGNKGICINQEAGLKKACCLAFGMVTN